MQKKAAYSLIVKKGMRFEIPLNGTAWTYIGASGAAEGILYLNRKYEASKVFFAFDPVIVGEYLLEFTRQDVLLDDIETIFVRVIVDPENGEALASRSPVPASASGITASSSPANGNPPGSAASALPAFSPQPDSLSILSAASTPFTDGKNAVPGSAAVGVDALDGPALLKKIQKDLDASAMDSAQAALESYRSRFPLGEEYLYWSARYYESPGPQRDILKSRALYVQLMEQYPESSRYDAADARIEYIDRRYLEIR
jgi:hypothetical protein